ncbi:hypothetical protein RE476_02515 [Methanolobus mangrovi]|uniref:Uncharacterized protein n=1 Tax=Methanolobus mangrovi TaxID=3072977 RepID=A0AA51YH25_9EURY|nr:hypothetical protein [Methanolobus mangrovi]WMW22712.1 hypothetical protein RE476_02515 [Methanolobus mangrovi]
MDIRDFVKKQESALKKYRRVYKILDFLTISLVLFTLMFLLNMDKVFAMMTTFEVRAGTSYDLAGISIAFENVALALISAFMALILTFLIHRRDDRTGILLLVEEKYPNLQEKLRTAYDNRETDNIIVNDLLNIVSSGISKVQSSAFLKRRRLTLGLILILASASTLGIIMSNDIHTDFNPEDVITLLEDAGLLPQDEDTSGDLYDITDEGSDDDGSGTEDLTGETAIIVVEGTEVDLTLPPGTGTGFSNQQEAEEADEDFDQSSPYEISIISSQAYYEELPEGYESVIKSYFEEMAKN